MSSHNDEVDDVAPIAGPSGVARLLLVEEESAEGTSVAASSFYPSVGEGIWGRDHGSGSDLGALSDVFSDDNDSDVVFTERQL